MTGGEPPPDAPDGKTPSDGFDRRLAAAQADRNGTTRKPVKTERSDALGMGFRIGVDLVAALAVGVGIGYGLDRWLGTTPWLMIGFFFLGAGAGVMSVFRAVNGMGYAVGYRDSAEDKRPPRDRK